MIGEYEGAKRKWKPRYLYTYIYIYTHIYRDYIGGIEEE